MAINTYRFWMATDANRLLANQNAFIQAAAPAFYQGNVAQLELHIVASSGVGTAPVEVPFPAGAEISVAVGDTNTYPTGGSWELSVDGVETEPMPYNATTAQVASALNALPSVSSAGGVNVYKTGDGYTITWNTYGLKPTIGIGSDTLTPSSYESISLIQAGSAENRQIVFVELRQNPIALGVDWTPLPTPSVTVSEVQAWNGTNKIYRVTISPQPKAGTITISYGTKTATLAYNASPASISSALSPAQAFATGQSQWDIAIAEDSVLTASGSLVGYNGYSGSINFATAESHQFLAGAERRATTLEVSMSVDDKRYTLIQTPCNIFANVVSDGVLVPLPLGVALSEQVANVRYVRRDVDQNPDASTLNVIWQNLGVETLGSDVAGALNGADSPSAANPFATISDIPTVTQAEWGNITGTLSNQTDLASELNFLNTTKYDVSNPAGYIDGSYLFGYATESWVQSQGYLTNSTLNGYALLSGSEFTGPVTFSGAGYINVGGYDSDGYPVLRFGSGTTPTFVAWGNFYFDGSDFKYGDGQNQAQTIASRLWVNNQGYLTSSALSPYITSATASATYQTIVGMSAYGAKAVWNTWTGKQTFTQGTAAGLRIASPSVVDPSSFEDGDIFITNSGSLVYRDAGVSKFVATNDQLALYAPLAGATFSGQVNIGSMALNAPRTEIQTSSIGATISITKGASQQAVLSVGEAFNNVPFLYISGSTGDATIHGGRFYSGGLFSGVEPYARTDGATFTNKVNFTSVGGQAGINIGIGGTSTSATNNGDLWITTGGANLNFRDGTGAWKVLAALSNGNVFTQPQAIQTPSNATLPALRVTNQSTVAGAHTVLVEDATNPDASAFIIDNAGNVGIGVATGYTSTSKVEVVGNVKADTFSNGTGPTFAVTSTAAHTGGTDTLDLLVTINGTSYRIGLRPA